MGWIGTDPLTTTEGQRALDTPATKRDLVSLFDAITDYVHQHATTAFPERGKIGDRLARELIDNANQAAK